MLRSIVPFNTGYVISINGMSGVVTLTYSDVGAIAASTFKQPNGVASLDSSGKLDPNQVPSYLIGAVNYQGTWNPNTNSPTLPPANSANKGIYYVISVAGTSSIPTGSSVTYNVGDWIVCNGATPTATYERIQAQSPVQSVDDATGAVKLPNASTTSRGYITLTNDLGGTGLSPSVLKINGVAVSGTPDVDYVLTANSSTAATWKANPYVVSSKYAAKGDLLAGSATASTPVVVSVGANGTFLSADSTAAGGIKWASLPTASDTVAGIVQLSSTAPSNDSTSAGVGTGTTAARADHVHRYPNGLHNGTRQCGFFDADGSVIYSQSLLKGKLEIFDNVYAEYANGNNFFKADLSSTTTANRTVLLSSNNGVTATADSSILELKDASFKIFNGDKELGYFKPDYLSIGTLKTGSTTGTITRFGANSTTTYMHGCKDGTVSGGWIDETAVMFRTDSQDRFGANATDFWAFSPTRVSSFSVRNTEYYIDVNNTRRIGADATTTYYHAPAGSGTGTGQGAVWLAKDWFTVSCNGKNRFGWNTTDFWVDDDIRPGTTNAYELGSTTNRWSVIWLQNGSLNGSDERLKDDIAPIDDALIDAWGEFNPWHQYVWKESKERKGDRARLSFGILAQTTEKHFADRGIEIKATKLLQHEKWEEKKERNRKFNPNLPESEDNQEYIITPAGDEYSVAYNNAFALEAAYMRKRVSELENQVNELYEKLNYIKLPKQTVISKVSSFLQKVKDGIFKA